ncbi:MAG: chemotaxis protein CheA [Desulfobulbaceae bacterium]
MADSSKFAGFLEKAADRLEQIQQSLLKHEKNPNDREFINDIFRSVHAIKNGALPAGFGRISELCFHLENFVQRIRQERITINQEKIDILVASRDRLGKLLHDIMTTDKERSTIKDLLKRIQEEMEAVPEVVTPEPPPAAAAEVLPSAPEPEPEPEPLSPALSTLPAEIDSDEEGATASLLPDEIRNQEYDRELFQIFVEQMQDNLSLLRALANGYEKSANKAKTISLSSDLVGKLQTSANYMGYDRLADYYIQWVAELEMAGVELSMGTPVSLDFMEERIRTVTDLFPQVKDTPAAADVVRKAEEEMVQAQPVAQNKTPAPEGPEETAFFKDLFSDMDEEESFEQATGPIAALSGFASDKERSPVQPAGDATVPTARKTRIKTQAVEIDATFLDEERQSPEFDEELFQIFVQQLGENLSELRALVDSYPKAPNKSAIVNQCSSLVGKLQASANYMGYERLAEYYLQWIAELEMAGVDLSLGSPISFSFMEEKIRKIGEIFPQVQDVSAPVRLETKPGPIPPPAPRPEPAVQEPDESESFKELFTGMEDEGEDTFREDSAPVAALTGFAEEEGWMEPGLVATDLEEVDNFFGDLGEEPPVIARQTAPSPTAAFDVEKLFDEAEGVAEPEPVAALSGAEKSTGWQEPGPTDGEDLSEVDDFFGALGVDLPDLTPKPKPAAAPAEPASAMEDLFVEDFEAEDETLAALADSAAADLFQAGKPAATSRKIAEPAEDLASLFGEEEMPFPAPEEPAPAALPAPPQRQELFRKLSDALKSLDEEVPTLEAAVDKSRGRAARPASVAAPPQPARVAADDEKLFARLLGALEATAEDDDRGAAKPIDQVIEEILAAEEVPTARQEPRPEELPVPITIPDVRHKFGLDAERLDSLMDQVGELVVNKTSLSQLYREMSTLHHHLQESHVLDLNELTPLQNLLLRLEDTTNTLGRVSSEIREGVLKVRMIPAGQLFSLYRELAGDLAGKEKRQVELSIQGGDTEIDQFTAGDIGDCLLHLISNGIKHGIEPAEERVQLGKNAAGTVTLSAAHQGTHAVIEVADDGRGIDPKIIKAAALARDMFSGDELYTMSDHDLTRLIMTPGFSTAAGTTPDSGVPGLDRVKTIMDRLGGTVQISSKVGQGTRVRLLIPLKLPTFRTLKVKAGTGVFALPLSSVEEIVRVTPENLIRRDDTELLTFRHENIMLHSLARIAGLEAPILHGERFPVVVVSTDEGLIGLIVDEMIGLEEIPVQPVAEYLREHHDFAGTAVIDEGDFSFIADVAGLMKTATAARI